VTCPHLEVDQSTQPRARVSIGTDIPKEVPDQRGKEHSTAKRAGARVSIGTTMRVARTSPAGRARTPARDLGDAQ
jgi:hypothetical protein